MLFLRKDLSAVKNLLDFYVTPYETEEGKKNDASIVGWDSDTADENSMIIPIDSPCGLSGVKSTGKGSLDISSIVFDKKYQRRIFHGEGIRVPLSFHRLEITSDHTVIAEIESGGNKYPGIVLLRDGGILYAFDPGLAVRNLLFYEYLAKKTSSVFLTAINSVGANIAAYMPLALRNTLIKAYLVLAKNVSRDSGFPSWPMDNSSDLLRDVFLKTLVMVSCNKEVSFVAPWPEGKRSCFCSTHDVDTTGGFKKIPFVRRTEEKYSIPSTWFITHEINPDVGLLKNLEASGCEVGSHGWLHDDRLGLIACSEVEERFSKSVAQYEGLKLSGFRAPYNGFHPHLFPIMKKYVKYDSSAQETRIYASVKAHRLGCCTMFPYEVNGITELPSTLPPDYLLINTLGYDPERVYRVWEEKLVNIMNAGGMALMQTHPEEFDIGNDRFIEPYRRVLEKVSAMEDCFIASAADVASWWAERASCRLGGDGELTPSASGPIRAVLMKMRSKGTGFVAERA